MAAGNEQSKISILFGDEFEGKGETSFNLQLDFSADSANSLNQEIKDLTQNQIQDGDWKIIIEISTEPGKQSELEKFTQQIINGKADDQDKLSGFQEMYQQFSQEGYSIEFKIINDKLYVILSPGEILEELKAPFDMFFEQGLSDLTLTQKNTINVNVGTNTTTEAFIKSLKEKERISSALLSSAKVEILAQINKDFGSKIQEFCKNIDEDLANSVPLVFLKYFQSLEIDLKFASTQELPEVIRRNLLPIKNDVQNNPTIIEMYEDILVKALLENIGTKVQAFLVIPQFLALRAELSAPKFSQFFHTFGKEEPEEE